MVDERSIQTAVDLLLQAAPPGTEVILFGSYARGEGRVNSDLDFLIVEPELSDRRGEAVRLRSALRQLRLPVDVLVVSRQTFNAWKDIPNNIIHEAVREGRVYARAA